jgi:hypothetical protein
MFTGHTCGTTTPLVVLTYSHASVFLIPVVKPGAMVADNFNPFTYHLTNVLLHLGATAMSFSCSAHWAPELGAWHSHCPFWYSSDAQ